MIRIALVEDDPTYREQMRGYLERYGKESGEKLSVTEFTDGENGAKVLTVSGFMMPEANIVVEFTAE